MRKVVGITTLFGFYVTFELFFIYLHEEKIKDYKRVSENFFKSDMSVKILPKLIERRAGYLCSILCPSKRCP